MFKKMKLVSVIVLAYRSAETIVQTLDSIKAQDYGNIELIITDDCSPDNTVETAEKWMEKNKGTHCGVQRMQIVTTGHNTGIPGNINRALAHASGAYVKIIAADDYMTPDAITAYTAFCEDHPGTAPIARVHLFSDEAADFTDVENYCKQCYEFAKMDYREQYRMLLTKNCIVAPSGSFYPMEALKKAGGYDEHYRWFEDYPMNLKLMHAGLRFGFLDRELVWYRISGNSITASQMARLKKTEMRLFFREKAKYMIQAGMAVDALRQSKYWIKITLSK